MGGLPPVQSQGLPPHERPGAPAGRLAAGRRPAPGRPDVGNLGLDRRRFISMDSGVAVGRLAEANLVTGARALHGNTASERSRATGHAGDHNPAEVRAQARAFEALLVQNLVHELREKGLSEGFFGSGVGGDVYGFMFDTQMAAALSDRLSLGLAEQMAEQLERRGAASAPPLPALPTEMLLAASGVVFGPQDSTLRADKKIDEGEDTP